MVNEKKADELLEPEESRPIEDAELARFLLCQLLDIDLRALNLLGLLIITFSQIIVVELVKAFRVHPQKIPGI